MIVETSVLLAAFVADQRMHEACAAVLAKMCSLPAGADNPR